jgi:hypothetical protein
MMMTLTFQSGTAPAFNATLCTIAWSGGNGMFTTPPQCFILPSNANAWAAATANTALRVVGGVNGIVVTTGAVTALAAATNYVFGIIVSGK